MYMYMYIYMMFNDIQGCANFVRLKISPSQSHVGLEPMTLRFPISVRISKSSREVTSKHTDLCLLVSLLL